MYGVAGEYGGELGAEVEGGLGGHLGELGGGTCPAKHTEMST